MVVAGPGTGKTSVLALRIANILRQTDTAPSSILALSFTDAGVTAMRKKLLEIIGPRAYEVRLHTFHSFANDLIKRYPEEFPHIIGAEHMEGLEQIRIVETLLTARAAETLRPKNNPLYYVLPVIQAIQHCKREGITPAGLLTKHLRTKEFRRLYCLYEKELRRRRLYDFEDMVISVVGAFLRNTNFKRRLQEEYQFVLADEHQDANQSQNRLLELLCDYDDTPNLFIVGDAKQAIFRFQGASRENFSFVKRRFPRAHIIALSENYRSQPTILAGAYSLLKEDTSLRARASHPAVSIIVAETEREQKELAYVVGEIAALLKKGVPAREIAVFTRENETAQKWEEALRAAGIPAARRGDTNALESVRIDALRRLFVAVLEPQRDELLVPVLFFDFLGLPFIDVLEVIHPPSRRASKKKDGSLVRRLGERLGVLAAFQKKIMRWASIARNEPLIVAFETIAHESGFIEKMFAREHDAPDVLRLYDAFLESARRLAERDKCASLADFLERLARAEAHGLGVISSAELYEGIPIMTAHKAKGLEFDYCFIVGAREGKWGGKRDRALFELPSQSSDEREREADERRLFYVALTRARKGVQISWHARDEHGRALSPSRFIFELDEKTRKHISLQNPSSGHASAHTDIFLLKNSSCSPRRARKVRFGVPAQRVLQNKEYLNSLFLNQGFAATHLNNFLACPLKYFFLNLVRLPRAQSNQQLYGNAMHKALAAHFSARSRDADKPFTAVATIFEGALRRTHIGERDFRAFLSEGKRELKGYLASREFPRTSWNEYRIGGVFVPVGREKVELTGMLDKIELLPEGGIVVVDYKTGKVRSRNELLGKTKDADGNYYRQLVFYTLLLDGYKKRGWNMKKGAIDFIKPDLRGNYRREEFDIAETEVTALKKQIVDIAASILDLSFLQQGCRQKKCEWCRLYAATSSQSQ